MAQQRWGIGGLFLFSFFFPSSLGDGVSDHQQQPVPICVGFKRNVVYVLSLSVKSVWEDFQRIVRMCVRVCYFSLEAKSLQSGDGPAKV